MHRPDPKLLSRLAHVLRHRRVHVRSQAGVALVEFALVLPLLLVLVIGMMDFGKAINYWLDQNHLASMGARWAAVNKNPGPGTLQQSIRAGADTAELQTANVCISIPNARVGEPVTVTMRYRYNWIPFITRQLGIGPISIGATATMRLEALPTNYTAGDGGTGSCT